MGIRLRLTQISMMCILTSACAKQTSTEEVTNGQEANPLFAPIINERATCEIQTPHYLVNTNIISLQMKDEGGITIGFDLGGSSKFMGFNFKIKRAQMTIAMEARDPLQSNAILASTRGVSDKVELKASFNIELGKIKISPGYYFETPLANLSFSSLKKGLQSLGKLLQNESPWTANVLAVPTMDEIVINAGTLAGIREGDEFAVYNVEHIWMGEPCQSEYIMDRHTTDVPLAIYQATNQLIGNRTILKLASARTSDEIVHQGAKVYISKLVKNKKEKNRDPLKKQVLAGTVSSLPIEFNGNDKIYLNEIFRLQFNAAITESPFTQAPTN